MKEKKYVFIHFIELLRFCWEKHKNVCAIFLTLIQIVFFLFLAQVCTLNSIFYVKRTCKTHFEPSGMVPDGAKNHPIVLKWIQIESPFNSNQILISFYRFIIVMTGELIILFYFFFIFLFLQFGCEWITPKYWETSENIFVIVFALNTH